jgi:hypothetical protein
MSNPPILYSTNTWLAYNINEHYYHGQHYVWCSRYFDAKSLPAHRYSLPPTSSPSEIYNDLEKAVVNGDLHNSKIQANKIGILNGAAVKRLAGLISAEQQREIAEVVGAAQILDFRPLLYVIPISLVADSIKDVPISGRAHPLALEVVIECLSGTCFDVIELPRS